MNPTEHLAHFDGATTDVPMTGSWYSHARVTELVEAARQECRDRDATEADVRARLADAEKALARVLSLPEQWAYDYRDAPRADRILAKVSDDLRAALDGGR